MKKQNITLSLALAAVFSSSVAFAETEVTGKIIHESATFTESGIGIGAATTSTQTANSHGKDVFKSATQAKIFVDGDVSDSAYHVELNAFNDGKGTGDYDGNESYTQRDALREAYVDTGFAGWSIRAGKQQTVWGTADGMKLLDAINPTDYSEMAQNQMEDSRIPVWMLNAEKDTDSGVNWQFIISEGKSSHFAGMGDSSSTVATTHYSISDTGHAFKMKGADTISGRVNGMINVVPAMGAVATAFQAHGNSNGMTMASVNDFATNTSAGETAQHSNFAAICTGGSATSIGCLETITNASATQRANQNAGGATTSANNAYAQNLLSDTTAAQWTAGKENSTSVFHYMPDATFATFDQFVGLQSKYTVDHNSFPTMAARYKNTTSDGLNYSVNFMNGNDTNPYVDTYWTSSADSDVLAETATASAGGVYTTNNLGDGTVVGGSAAGTTYAIFNMVEKLNRISQLGGSFDTAIETAELGPVVLRGEALYQHDVMSPIVTRKDSTGKDLNHGFLVSGLKMEKGDRFKYVLGADMTALTNMMVSVQFIQDVNLDYVDVGNKDATNWKYTADMATMSLTNNLNKAEEFKEFYSLFMSKPFGASGEHRWNNILMLEDGGGKWNRLDAEFSINDDTQATVEWNKYFGDENTQFGQL
ncbi:MAG TPA: RNA polymerase-associated protein rapA, partial [Thiotrichaceae bacterium]|nr:RNA polymerase-associated protein rapA [Thiotrichaceae bacterium]